MKKIIALSFVVFGLGCAVEVEIPFDAVVGDETWSCGSTFDDIGTSASTITPKDFRVYIHDITLGALCSWTSRTAAVSARATRGPIASCAAARRSRPVT